MYLQKDLTIRGNLTEQSMLLLEEPEATYLTSASSNRIGVFTEIMTGDL